MKLFLCVYSVVLTCLYVQERLKPENVIAPSMPGNDTRQYIQKMWEMGAKEIEIHIKNPKFM